MKKNIFVKKLCNPSIRWVYLTYIFLMTADSSHHGSRSHEDLQVPSFKMLKKKLSTKCCLVFLHMLLGIIILVAAVAVIVVASASSVMNKSYGGQKSRVVGTIALAMTSVVTVLAVICALIGIYRKNATSLHLTAGLLLLLAFVQGLVLCIFVTFKKSDEIAIHRSLIDTFVQAKEHNLEKVKLFEITQSELKCCGVNGPMDYQEMSKISRNSLQVPLSCCPTYNPKETKFYESWQTELCTVNQMYYKNGCLEQLLATFRLTSAYISGFTGFLIIGEVLVSATGIYLATLRKREILSSKKDSEIPQTSNNN